MRFTIRNKRELTHTHARNSHEATMNPIRHMLSRRRLTCVLLISMMLAMAGCMDQGGLASDEATGNPNINGGGSGVGQSGAQDFGRFRSIIEDGEIPAPNTLDVVGFFNEHKFELPAPDCGENVCVHGMFGVWGNMINGANCTLTMLGFNTPINAKDFERPPLNMAIAVDISGSMGGEPIEAVRSGLLAMAEKLNSKDRITLVTYSTDAQVVFVSDNETDPDRSQLEGFISNLQVGGGTNIYEGLRLALTEVEASKSDTLQNRVILLSDGMANEGLTNEERIINLGASYAEQGVGITTIGVGKDFDIELMRRLSESGSGNFYFVEDLYSVEEIFVVEADTFLVPVAEDVNIEFDVAKGYRFRAAYGTRTWEGDADGATISIPGLFIATRESVEDVDPGGGRRGGGGAILFEVVPTSDQNELAEVGAGEPIGQIRMTYRQPGTDNMVTQETTVLNELEPGETPDEGAFDNAMVEKAFVALNIFVGFKLATERYAAGAPIQALSVLLPLAEQVELWLEENEDIDIQSDLETLNALIALIEEETPTQNEIIPAPPQPWPRGD